MNIELFPYRQVLFETDLLGWFWAINPFTLRDTWIAMALLLGVAVVARYALRTSETLASFSVTYLLEFFVQLMRESFGICHESHLYFITSLFLFTAACNTVGVLPIIEEPTRDLNTTLAIGLISFFYVQVQKMRYHGFLMFAREYVTIIPTPYLLLTIILSMIINVVALPLSILGECAKIVSMSFRLYGNILGGSILLLLAAWAIKTFELWFILYAVIVVPLAAVILIFDVAKNHPIVRRLTILALAAGLSMTFLELLFGIAEGLIQAYVITMLTTTYLSVALTSESGNAREQENHG